MAILDTCHQLTAEFDITRRGGTAKQVFLVNESDVSDIKAEVFPSGILLGSDIYIPPARHFPNISWLVAQRMRLTPYEGTPDGANEVPATFNRGKWQLEIEYATPEFDQEDANSGSDGPGGPLGSAGGYGPNGSPASNNVKTFISHKVDIGGEFITYASGALEFELPNNEKKPVPEDGNVAIVIPIIDHSITWHFVPFPPWFAMRLSVGCVNAYPFAGAPAETLLFTGASASREVTSEGIRAWSLDYKFGEKNQNPWNSANPQGWNHFLRTDGTYAGTFQRVNRKTPGGKTKLREPLLAATAAPAADAIKVDSNHADFTTGRHRYLQINDEIVLAGADNGTKDWDLSLRGLYGTVVADHPVSSPVRHIPHAGLGNNISTTSTQILVDDATLLPEVGQMLLRIGDEIMCCTRRDGNALGVLRGIRGETPVAHLALDAPDVLLWGMPVFPLQDFRVLFLSGLLTG